ncbi:MAG TPA: penicillin-insensitive murein endopeptidase [Haliangiales bacterium]|nr:penicillin-insensitive murein endopeptidase [Haliangiales bacterium]
MTSANARPARPRFRAVALPPEGRGYLVPTTWRERGLRWGTPELVGLVKRAAARVRAWDRSATVYVADLSLRSGGATEWHRSHRLGIDVDLLYFASTAEGRQAPPPRAMSSFDEEGATFDVRRNWLLVKALLTDPAVQVTAIFMAEWIKDRLLDYARERGEGTGLILRALSVLGQPSDSAAHDDHMHVRIAEPPPPRAAAAREVRSSRARGGR